MEIARIMPIMIEAGLFALTIENIEQRVLAGQAAHARVSFNGRWYVIEGRLSPFPHLAVLIESSERQARVEDAEICSASVVL